MNWSTPRKSRKTRRCACGQIILPGDPYLDHRTSPHDNDLNNSRWWRAPECYPCAAQYGREHLFNPCQWGEFATHAYYGTWYMRPTVQVDA